MDIRQAYTNWSGSYDSDRNLTRDLDAIVTRQMLVGYRSTTILELGCGTGKNTAFLADIGEQVYAFDFSEGMILEAQSKLAGQVSFAIADLTRPWPCAGECIHLLVCNLVLEHIGDLNPIFSEAHRVLKRGGHFFISELHPFKQYQGKKAVFQRDEGQVEIPAFVHHISDFVAAAQSAGFRLNSLREWWHEEDDNKPPRLVSFLFEK